MGAVEIGLALAAGAVLVAVIVARGLEAVEQAPEAAERRLAAEQAEAAARERRRDELAAQAAGAYTANGQFLRGVPPDPHEAVEHGRRIALVLLPPATKEDQS